MIVIDGSNCFDWVLERSLNSGLHPTFDWIEMEDFPWKRRKSFTMEEKGQWRPDHQAMSSAGCCSFASPEGGNWIVRVMQLIREVFHCGAEGVRILSYTKDSFYGNKWFCLLSGKIVIFLKNSLKKFLVKDSKDEG